MAQEPCARRRAAAPTLGHLQMLSHNTWSTSACRSFQDSIDSFLDEDTLEPPPRSHLSASCQYPPLSSELLDVWTVRCHLQP